MKPFNLLIVFLFASSTLIAQNRNDFNGPAHKNYKPWQHKVKPVVIYNNLELNKLESVALKNYKFWNVDKENIKTVKIKKSERMKLQGPEYKNYKPWRNKNY